MNDQRSLKTIPAALGLALALGLTGCSSQRTAQVEHSPSTATVATPGSNHGLNGTYTYHYYPSDEVYFAPDRGVYFWHAAAYWGVGQRLPSTYRLDSREKVTLKLDTKMPYRQHNLVVARYPVTDTGKYASVDPNEN